MVSVVSSDGTWLPRCWSINSRTTAAVERPVAFDCVNTGPALGDARLQRTRVDRLNGSWLYAKGAGR